MATQIDVYKEWLGIQEAERPLSHYQLLRLKQFEDDAAKIRGNYRKMNAHVRKYAAGDYARQSQDLLNELAKAMLCLTDRARKEEYDASLGREATGGRRYSFEQLLVGRRIITAEQLAKARNYASAVGLDLRDAVTQQKMAAPDVVMQAYAEGLGLPYIELADIGLDLELVPKIPAQIARQHSCAPVMVDEGTLLMASPNPLRPEVEDELRLRLGMPVRTVLCTAASMNEAIGQHYSRAVAAAEMAGGAPPPVRSSASDVDDDEAPADRERGGTDSQTQQVIVLVSYVATAALTYLALKFGFKMKTGMVPFYAAVACGAMAAGIAYMLTKKRQ
jgi:hypothetical protein